MILAINRSHPLPNDTCDYILLLSLLGWHFVYDTIHEYIDTAFTFIFRVCLIFEAWRNRCAFDLIDIGIIIHNKYNP